VWPLGQRPHASAQQFLFDKVLHLIAEVSDKIAP
jgi:hypothetical protein